MPGRDPLTGRFTAQYSQPAEPLHGTIRNFGSGPNSDLYNTFDKRQKGSEARENLSRRGIGPSTKKWDSYLERKGIGPSRSFKMSDDEQEEDWDVGRYRRHMSEQMDTHAAEKRKLKTPQPRFKSELYTIRDM